MPDPHVGYYRPGQQVPSTYYTDSNGDIWGNADDMYYSENYGLNMPAWLRQLPEIIGHWVGRGVNAYTESSTDFSRWYNSPENQMGLYDQANVNPYEGFLSGNGNSTVQQGSADPLAALGGYISNFMSLAHGLADLRSKNIANKDAQIDLLRKQFENKWFFGNSGEITTETIEGPDGPMVITTNKGYIKPIPEIDYETKKFGRSSSESKSVTDRFNALVHQYMIDNGWTENVATARANNEVFGAYEKEYRAKREKLTYEWENFLKNELGVDPRTSPWLTTFLGILKNQSKSDSAVGRFLYGLLEYLKGNY